MSGFAIYAAFCALFYLIAIYALLSKKPIGASARGRSRTKIKDVRGYNRSAAGLFFAYGTFLLLCAVPTLLDISPVLAMFLSTIGLSIASIGLLVFAVKIEKKYR